MSTYTKRAVVVIAVVLAFMIYRYRVMLGVTVTGSGGLGAVSMGVSEAVLEFFIPATVVCLYFYWLHRRQRRRQPDRPATRA